MKYIFTLAFYCCTLILAAQQQQKIAIIPEPVLLTTNAGQFEMPANIQLFSSGENEVQFATNLLSKQLNTTTGSTVTTSTNPTEAHIELRINATENTIIGNEGYTLSVTNKKITIAANKAKGLYYGVQTLLQLLPAGTAVSKNSYNIPCVEITDYPRFKWRGLMLDVSRHFFTKEEVKKYIDEMAMYKFNLFHWHLTDDEGWRVQIKSLPKLTEVGAWNAKRVGKFGEFSAINDSEPRNYGGFYTQEEIKEVVQYAKERFVDVLPEIDVPGHSLAAIASYPELSCTAGAEKYKVASGHKFIEWPANGHFYGLLDNTLCPANEKVYPFLDKVFTEIAQLFPFEYIHVGGDECVHNYWEKSPQIKALMQKEQLKTMDEVQGYFEKRIQQIVNSKGKKMMGWDEILQGGISTNTAIMSWRGTKGGIEASNKGHEVVMSPTTYVYLDYMQSDEIMEPKVYASLRVNKTYSYEPISEGINEKMIKGVQGNLWSEQIYNYRQVQYMTWPRAFAISEIAWSPSNKKNWNSFSQKIEQHFKRFDAAAIKYAPSMYDADFKASYTANKELQVTLSTEIEGLTLHYSFDNSYPDQFYPIYNGPITVPIDATLLRVINYKGNTPIGRMMNMPIAELKKRVEKKKY
jgi:hexosaminidase